MCQNPNVMPADIILEQLGGSRKLHTMIGAKDFYSEDKGHSLVFKIGSGSKNNIKHIKITLDLCDTYTVIFTSGLRVVAKYSNIYCDMLCDLVEKETGFYLSFI